MVRSTRERPARFIARVALLGLAAFCLGWAAIAKMHATAYNRRARAAFETRLDAPAAQPDRVVETRVVGILSIPRLGMSEVVASGDDGETLDVALGHLPDTPLPWQAGNSAVAGHRDGRFRPLKGIKTGDAITVQTHHGVLHYRVRQTQIVRPSDVWVLSPTAHRQLTLITCYPFHYVGPAPRRFVVVADAIDSPADVPGRS